MFFKKPEIFGYPKFKRKKTDRNSFTTCNREFESGPTIYITKDGIHMTKAGIVKAKFSRRPRNGWKLKRITVEKTRTGKFYCYILYECPMKLPQAVTLTGIQPGGRFGVLDLEGQMVVGFREKAKEDGGWINGGFMVMEPEVLSCLNEEERCILKRAPLETLAREGKLGIYKHFGFWQCMGTQRDWGKLENLWQSGAAPWRIWADKRGDT